jgi:hypothetical protein
LYNISFKRNIRTYIFILVCVCVYISLEEEFI